MTRHHLLSRDDLIRIGYRVGVESPQRRPTKALVYAILWRLHLDELAERKR